MQGQTKMLDKVRPVGFRSRDTVASVISRRQRREQQGRLREILNSLPESERLLYLSNPHLQQVAACRLPLQRQLLFTEQDRILNIDTAPRAPYQRRTEEIKTVVHSGQRKLLIVEVEFLSRFYQPNDVVVYAGAAGGSHQDILASMFPQLLFLLYDPNPFSVQPTAQREIYQDFFTIQTAQQLAIRFKQEGRRILFLSDVRRVDRSLPELEQQNLIVSDLQEQKVWLEILQPAASLLKFVMPYPLPGVPEKIEYLNGTIFLQPWVGPTSTETRLLVLDHRSVKEYDVKQYEEVLFYHNQITRATYYEAIDGVPPAQTGCHCYDCSAELFVLYEYARHHRPDLDVPALIRIFDTMFQ